MATSKEYCDYILEQLSEISEIGCCSMMGEYIIYCRGKVIGGIYDNRFMVKPTESAKKLMPNAGFELPYDGAKKMLLVDNTEDKEFLKNLLESLCDELQQSDF